MYRITRIWNYHLVARLDQRQHQVREALFRADGRYRLGFRIDLNAVTARVPARDFHAQVWNAARRRVTMISRIARGLDQFIDNRIGRGQVWIAHAQIDDVFAAMARFHFQMVDDGKYIGWKFFDKWKSVI